MITPSQMAEVYWSRLRGRAHREIDGLIKQFESAPKTRMYWTSVKACLAARK